MSAPSVAADFSLSCRVSAPVHVHVGKRVPLTFTLTNKGPGSVNVLTWNTPLEGLTGRFLRVIAPDGSELDYGGIMVKRAPPGPANYLRIRKGSTRERTIDLARAYAFTTRGTYRITYVGDLMDAHAGKLGDARAQLTPHTITCPEISITIR